jgi:hypothetical protein
MILGLNVTGIGRADFRLKNHRSNPRLCGNAEVTLASLKTANIRAGCFYRQSSKATFKTTGLPCDWIRRSRYIFSAAWIKLSTRDPGPVFLFKSSWKTASM